MRSLMFVPGHQPHLLEKSAKSDADVLLFDIEDSVQPKLNKEVARTTVARLIESGTFKHKPIFPRINDRESGELLKDLNALCIEGVNGFVYPKAKTGKDIYFFCKLLETIEYEKQLPIGTFKIIPLIETTSAVIHAFEIASASPRVVAIAYGCEDYLADLQGKHGNNQNALFYPRSVVANAARAAGITPIDTVHIDVHNYADLEKNLQTACELGFEGMLILNPKEIPFAHRYFSPTPEDVQKARRIIEVSENAVAKGRGVALEEDVFAGPPLVLKAKKILERHHLCQK